MKHEKQIGAKTKWFRNSPSTNVVYADLSALKLSRAAHGNLEKNITDQSLLDTILPLKKLVRINK